MNLNVFHCTHLLQKFPFHLLCTTALKHVWLRNNNEKPFNTFCLSALHACAVLYISFPEIHVKYARQFDT